MKKFQFFALMLALFLTSFSFTSAYYSYDKDYYKKTTNFERRTERYGDYGGYGTRTYTIKTTLIDKGVSRPYYDYYPLNGHYPIDTNWRYKRAYNYYDYGDDEYGRPYYYEPRYSKGHYNWRY